MTLLNFLCDLVGLAVMCTLAVITAVVYSLLKLLMAGFLRLALTLLTRKPGILSRVPRLNLKILKKGNKSWLSLTLGKITLAAALTDNGVNAGSARISSLSAGGQLHKAVESVDD